MMARESHTTPLLCREVVRENRVNQSGSVALSTEAMRGPPWRNLLIIMALSTQTTNQGVVGSNPAGRAIFQRLGTQNQVFLTAVGPLWDLLSTGPRYLDAIEGLGVQNQVLLPLLWNSVGVLIHTRALVLCDS